MADHTIAIVDDHPLFRDALRVLLEDHGHEVVAEATTCVDAVDLTLHHAPDVVLMDLCDPISNVTNTTRQILARLPDTADAAAHLHGTPSIVIDFGTAVTFDVIVLRPLAFAAVVGGAVFLIPATIFTALPKDRELESKSLTRGILL